MWDSDKILLLSTGNAPSGHKFREGWNELRLLLFEDIAAT
jgi:hypothetical protein